MALIDGLIPYWKLDESSGDAVDAHSTLDLTDLNGAGADTGVINGSRVFDAGNLDGLEHADDPSLSFANEDFSGQVWFNPDSLPAAGNVIAVLSKGTVNPSLIGGGTGEYELLVQTVLGIPNDVAQVTFAVRDGAGNVASVSVTIASDAGSYVPAWHHVVFWHDAAGDLIGVRVDGGTAATQSYTHGCHDGTNVFRLGRDGDDLNAFGGKIDEAALWGNLNARDYATELYNSGFGLAYPFTAVAAGGPGNPYHRRARKQFRRQIFHTGLSPEAEDVVVRHPPRRPPDSQLSTLNSQLVTRRRVPGPAAAVAGKVIAARRIRFRLSTLDSRLSTRRREPHHTGQTPSPIARRKRRAVAEVRGQRSEISVRRRVPRPGAAAAVAGRIIGSRRVFPAFRLPPSAFRRRPVPNPGVAAAVAGRAVPARRLRAHNPDAAFREPLSFRRPLPNPGAAAAVAGGVPRRRIATNAVSQRPLPTSRTLRRRHPRFADPPAGVVIRSRRQLVAPTRGDLRFLWQAYDSRPPWLLGLSFGAFARLNGFEIPKHRGRRFGAFAKG